MAWSYGPYFVEDICEMLIGRNQADGTPETALGNSYLIRGLRDFEVTDTYVDATDTDIPTASGATSFKRRKRSRYDESTLTLRRTGSIDPRLFVEVGLGNAVQDTMDAAVRTVGVRKPSSSAVCRCDDCQGTNVSSVFAIAWSQAWEPGDGEIRLQDGAGNCLWHVDVFPRIEEFRPAGPLRVSDDATSTQVDWTADLKSNPNFGNGPVDPVSGENIYPTENAGGLTTSHAAFLSPIGPAAICGGDDVFWDVDDGLNVLGSPAV